MSSVLINEGGRVLAAVDASIYARSVAELAAWAAHRLQAPLELLRTLERDHYNDGSDLSGSLSLGGQEELLAKLTALDEQRGKLAQEHSRILLTELQGFLSQRCGVQAQVRQRHGELVDALLESESDVRLFVLGKRGEHADFAKGHLGSNLERVMRSVHRPVLVAARGFKPINRFMIAYDGSATTRKCVEMVCASPLLKGLQCALLHVGEPSTHAAQGMQWAEKQLTSAGFQPLVQVTAGAPEQVLAAQVKDRQIDLLVMGAYGHSKIRSLIVGSTTTQVLRSCLVPVLLLR